jgi:hypothetical protein
MEFCKRFVIIHDAVLGFIEKILWTNEPAFKTNGGVN